MLNQLNMAIVFVKRSEIRTHVADDLAKRGFRGVLHSEDAERCAETLLSNPLSLLVMDDEHTEYDLVSVLKAAQGRYRVDTRPIYFITYAPEVKSMARALEYNVTQLHNGEFDSVSIGRNITELLDYGQRTEMQIETFDRVLRARRSGESRQALDLLQRLYEEESSNAQVVSELAMSLCENDQWSVAKELLIDVVDRFPFDARAKHLMARCLMREGKFIEAQLFLEQASILSPLHAERLADTASVLLNQSKVTQAMGFFQEALSLDPDCRSARMGQVQCELLLGSANDALKIIKQIEEPSDVASVFNGAAIVAVRSGKYKQGISLYKTALSQLSAHPELSSRVLYNLGVGLYKWGKGDLAISAFDRAVELDADNEKARHNIEKLSGKFKRRELPSQTMSSLFEDESDDDFNEQSLLASA